MQTLLAVHQAIVGNEAATRGFSQARFHHGVTALSDFNAGLFGKLWRAPIEGGGALSEGAQCIELCHGLRQFGERVNVVLQLV